MECFVSLPNSTVKTVEVSLKGNGQECMDKLCEQLDITEQDYFGLVYKTRCGDSYWLNLRNRIDRQMFGQPPFRLFLKVKFFVPPHDLLFTETRNQFYEQVKQYLEIKKLVLESEDDIEQTVALMAQIEYGQHDTQTHQLNIYKRLYSIVSDQDPSQQQIRRFVDTHIALGHMTKEQAQYRVVQNVFKLVSYGVEYHDVMLDSEAMTVGVGPKGVFMYNSDMELIERIMFQRITKAEHTGRSCTLRIVNDNASEMDLVLKHSSPSMANAMYRSVTEMHSFFFCDTVHDEVSMQFSRDLKGTLASIFNEHTTLGRDYVFDIKRTAQEALDYARRQSYQMSHDVAMENKAMELKRSESKTRLQPAEERCKVLEETLEEIADTLTCCVCADSELNTTLVPCGHLLCWECAERLTECPLCRTEVSARQRVYYPSCKGATDMRSVSLKVVASPVHAHTHCYKKRRKTDLNSRMKP